jgi:hypothetical protein
MIALIHLHFPSPVIKQAYPFGAPTSNPTAAQVLITYFAEGFAIENINFVINSDLQR